MKEYVRHAKRADMRRAFAAYRREELRQLAVFLTGNQELADTCMVDACALAVTYNQVFLDWLAHWARRATIVSAARLLQARIAQLGALHERHSCPHPEHPLLAPEEIELLKAQRDTVANRLDLLCRFALVMYGVEKYSAPQSALILGVSRTAFEGAYCAALESLKMLSGKALGAPARLARSVSDSRRIA
jgi:hypothetical protein